MSANAQGQTAQGSPRPELNGQTGPETNQAVVQGVLHDLNNLFQATLALVGMARQEVGKRHPADTKLLRVEECALRASALTSKLQSYLARRDWGGPIVTDLNSLAKDVWRALEAVHGHCVEIQVFTLPHATWVTSHVHDTFTAALSCAEELLRQAENASPDPLTLEISVDESAQRGKGLLEIRLKGRTLRAHPNGVLDSARGLLEASGGELEELIDARDSRRGPTLNLWLPLAYGGSRAGILTSARPADEVVGSALTDLVLDMKRVVSTVSERADRSGSRAEARNDPESPLR